jgi:REP element-mobilizing transposase RayT
MARKPRLHVFGGIYHVMLRGNNGQKIFFKDSDRYRLSLLIQHATYRYRCLIHGFCFMDNHIHLIIQVEEISLSKIMQNIAFRYTRWINFTQKRIGHLFQARFKAILVENESYLLQLLRYIHLNPVKAGLVSCAKDYYWSGHRTYLGIDNFQWLTTDWMLSQFSQHKPRQAYAKFIDSASDINEKEFLSEPKFKIQPPVVTYKYTFEDIVSFIYQKYHIDENKKIKIKVKAIIAWISIELKVCSMLKVAQYFKCDLSGISRKIRMIQNVNDDELNILKKEFIENVKCQA